MRETLFSKSARRPIGVGIFVFGILIFLTQAVSYQRYLLFHDSRNRELINAANVAREKLQAALNQSRAATQTLAFIVSEYGIENTFDSVAHELLENNQFVDALELVNASGTITHVYPLKENEAALGYNILKDTLRNAEAYKAIEKKELFFAGPFNLKQGGIAIVGRLPMFNNGNFTGFSVVLIRLSTIIKAAQIDTTYNPDYNFQLSKTNPETGLEEFFLPSPSKFQNGTSVVVTVPDGDWKIYVKPKKSDGLISPIPFSVLGFILSLIGGLLAWYIARQPYTLQALVDQRTESLQSEKTLSDTVINALPGIFYMADVNGKLLRWNKNVERITRYTAEEIAGMHTYNFLDLSDEKLSASIREEAIAKGVAIREVTIVTKYGKRLEHYFSVLFTKHNGDPCVLGIGIDITERKRAERAILEEKNLSDSIINSLPGIFYLYDEFGNFSRWNKNFETVSEYSAEEIINMHPLEFFDDSEKKMVGETISSVFTKGSDETEAHFYTKGRKKIPYYFNGHLAEFQGKQYLIGMGIDITERKRIESEIIASEQRLRTTLDNMIEAVQIIGFNWEYIYVNKAGLRQNRMEADEMLGYSMLEKYPGLENAEIFEKLKRSMKERIIQETEAEFTFPDGLKRWFQLSIQPIPQGIFILSVDVTEKKKAEQEFVREKVLSESIINSLPGIFYLSNAEGYLLRWNKNFETVSGYTAAELGQMRIRNFIEENDIDRLMEHKELAFKNGVTETEVNFVTRGRNKIPYYFTALRINHNQQLGLIGIGIDIAERKKAETEILQKNAEIKERVKELQCLYKVSDIANNPEATIESIIAECVHVLPLAYQYSEIAGARITLDGCAFASPSFVETVWKQSSDIISRGKKVGTIEVAYAEERKEEQEGPFVKEERAMLESVADIISNAIDRRKAQEEIVESEERYRYLFHNNPALIFIWDLETLGILEVNQTALQTYGYTREELLQLSVLKLRAEEDHQRIAEFAQRMLHSEEPVSKGIWRHLKKNGETMFMDITSHRIEYNNRKAILSLAKDITIQYKAEEELKKTYEDIRRLNAHLQSIREEERASIAREIHDELGQQLTGLKMDAAWLAKKLSDRNDGIQHKLSDMLLLIDTTVKTVRRISSDLRPGVLDDLGLIAALEWQSSEFQKRSGITCSFISDYSRQEPERNVATGIFRVYQEALTNVMRHAGATAVTAKLESTDSEVVLTITDNGKGFEQDEANGKKTLGLVGMKERAVMLGGNLVISSIAGEGTTITLKVPLNSSANV
jgi:PAS domain S-box-containing protein